MSDHRFALGERVYIAGKRSLAVKATGVYRVTRQLPAQDGEDPQYRVKSEVETYERVVLERDLSTASDR